MMRYYFGLLFFLSTFFNSAVAQELSYVDIYHPIAVREMHQYGIPASITLAQGILESGRGKSALAAEGNNHFGIKCHKGWEGPSMLLDDDAPDECFRVYEDAESSYKDHSIFLTTRSRYDTLFTFDRKDYISWAHGLSACGYATNPKYPELLISIIESANLQRFDDFAEGQYEVEGPYSSLVSENGNSPLSDSTNDSPPEASTSYPDLRENDGVFLLNRIQAVGYRGEALDSLAELLDLSILQLSKYNDLLAGESIPLGSPIYRQPKKKKGLEKTVTVQPGDNMWLISQWQGIRLTRLYLLNNMIPGEEPAVGEVLHLRKPSESKPTLRDKSEDNAETSQATEVRVEEEEGDTEANLEEFASQNVEIDTEIDREIDTEVDSEINEEKDAEVYEESEPSEHAVDISNDGSSEEALADVSSAPQVEVEVDGGQLSTFSEDESLPELVDEVETDVAEEDTEVTESLEPNPVNEENIAPDANQVPAETALSEPAPEVIETRERSFHTVSEGETLFSIARLYDLTLMNLKQWNALDGVSIEVGQKLFVEPR
tara:strand:+ start:1396 stop:3033 length:1638 start_codon:yes stop_codon:yes gene_type:complete